MLPDMDLDRERFDEIVEEARCRMVGMIPEWTDFNYHDPGITLIELFAWLKEIQQFGMNQMVKQNAESYFHLLGMKKEHRRPAAVMVEIHTARPVVWVKGTRVYAGKIAFETTKQKYLQKGSNIIDFRQTETIAEMWDFPVKEIIELNTYTALWGKARVFIKCGNCYYPGTCRRVQQNREEGAVFEIRIPENVHAAAPPDGIRISCYLSEEEERLYLGEADGLVNQVADIRDRDMEYETFEIMILSEGAFYAWEKVPDFCQSGYGDRHYVFDEERGILLFGNGKHGMPPKGSIYVVQAVRTRGSEGNVKTGMINRMEPHMGDCNIFLQNKEDAKGGRDTESTEEVWKRYRKIFRNNSRLITAQDYESAIMQMPGVRIESCKVLPVADIPNQVEIVVKPVLEEGKKLWDPEIGVHIQNYLENRRTVGTRIKLSPPQYADVSLFAGINIIPHYVEGKQQVKDVLETYFKEWGRDFGITVSHSAVYGLLDSLEAVAGVVALFMDIRGNGTGKDENGNLHLPPNGLVRLKDVRLSFYNADTC